MYREYIRVLKIGIGGPRMPIVCEIANLKNHRLVGFRWDYLAKY